MLINPLLQMQIAKRVYLAGYMKASVCHFSCCCTRNWSAEKGKNHLFGQTETHQIY